MKNLIYPLAFALTAFLFAYSCSAEEDTTPPPQVQQPTPEPPAPKQYTLTVTAGEGGTVSTEGGTYDEGTEITITATPAEGYAFLRWSDGQTDQSINYILNSNTSLTAVFEKKIFEVQRTSIKIDIENQRDFDRISELFGPLGIAGSLVFENESGIYYLAPGVVTCFNGECDNVSSSTDVEPAPSFLLKKDSNGWVFHKKLDNLKTWGIRNIDRYENYILLGDGNEIGSEWKGDIWLGEILQDNIAWNKVTVPETMAYYHDIAFGYLNDDNLIDIAGTQGKNIDGEIDYNLFFQNQNKTFEIQPFKSSIKYSEGGYEKQSFSIAIADLNQDGVDEIIVCTKHISILEFNQSSKKFEVKWSVSHDQIYPEIGMNESFWGTSIKISDFNNDGISDISVAREEVPVNNKIGITSFDVWIGNGDLSFEPSFVKKYLDSEFMFREFEVMDVNQDGNMDIVLKTNGVLGARKSPEYQIDNNDIRKGIKIDELIWINNGSGVFEKYFKEDFKLEGVYPRKVIPYMSQGRLHFAGSITNQVQNDPNSVDIELFDIKLFIE